MLPLAPAPGSSSLSLCRTQQMFAKRIINGKHPANKEILHKQFSKVTSHLKPAPQKTTNCHKKGRSQPGTIPQGREHVLWFIWHTNALPRALQAPFQSCPYTQSSGTTSIPQGSLGGAGLSPLFHMSMSPPVNHGSVEHIPETRQGDLLATHLNLSTPQHIQALLPVTSGSEVKVIPVCVPLPPAPFSRRKPHRGKGKAQRVSATSKME